MGFETKPKTIDALTEITNLGEAIALNAGSGGSNEDVTDHEAFSEVYTGDLSGFVAHGLPQLEDIIKIAEIDPTLFPDGHIMSTTLDLDLTLNLAPIVQAWEDAGFTGTGSGIVPELIINLGFGDPTNGDPDLPFSNYSFPLAGSTVVDGVSSPAQGEPYARYKLYFLKTRTGIITKRVTEAFSSIGSELLNKQANLDTSFTGTKKIPMYLWFVQQTRNLVAHSGDYNTARAYDFPSPPLNNLPVFKIVEA